VNVTFFGFFQLPKSAYNSWMEVTGWPCILFGMSDGNRERETGWGIRSYGCWNVLIKMLATTWSICDEDGSKYRRGRHSWIFKDEKPHRKGSKICSSWSGERTEGIRYKMHLLFAVHPYWSVMECGYLTAYCDCVVIYPYSMSCSAICLPPCASGLVSMRVGALWMWWSPRSPSIHFEWIPALIVRTNLPAFCPVWTVKSGMLSTPHTSFRSGHWEICWSPAGQVEL